MLWNIFHAQTLQAEVRRSHHCGDSGAEGLGVLKQEASLPAGRVMFGNSLSSTTPLQRRRSAPLTSPTPTLLCSAPAPFVTHIMPFGAECIYLVCMVDLSPNNTISGYICTILQKAIIAGAIKSRC